MCSQPGSIRSDNPPVLADCHLLPGLLVRGLSRVAPARALDCAESSTAERRSRRTVARVHGRDPAAGLKRDGEVSDTLGLLSESGHWCKAAGLTANSGVLAGRSLAAIVLVLADMRSIAACGVLLFWAHRCPCRSRQFAAVGMSESVRVACEAGRGSEWSGRKADESGQWCGRNSAEAVSLRSGRTASLGASRSRWATRGATAQGSARASVRSVTPGLLPFQIEERSDEASTIPPR